MDKSIVVTIRINAEDQSKIREIARRECRTFASQVRMAVSEWLKKYEIGYAESEMEYRNRMKQKSKAIG